MSEGTSLDLSWEGSVAVLTLSRPGVLNALDQDLVCSLIETLRSLGTDPSVQALVLTGEGSAFVAGADIAFMEAATLRQFRAFVEDLQELTRILLHSETPVIAALNGTAVGAGCEIACACDFRIAGRTAVLGFPEARLGLVVTSGASHLLPRLVGRGWARRLLLTGEMVSAEEAQRIGLVDGAFEPEEVLPAALRLGLQLAECEPLALRLSRSLLDSGAESSLETALHYEVEAILSCISEGQAKEGLRAFLEKREPRYERVRAAEKVPL